MKWLANQVAIQQTLGILLLVMTFTGRSRGQSVNLANSARAQRRILVSIEDCKLAVMEDGRVVRIFEVAVGAENSPSPTGRFQIVRRLTDPAYYHPGNIIPPGKDNPLGPRWVGLDQKGFGIHGTNQASSIGHARSHGCIRMRNHDIEQFFAMVSVGDAVEIRGERTPEIAQIFGGVASPTVAAARMADTGAVPAGSGH